MLLFTLLIFICLFVFIGKVFQRNQIDDLDKILFLEEFQLINGERMIQIRYYHFVTPNEIIGNNHQ